jgi:hypothetical protein
VTASAVADGHLESLTTGSYAMTDMKLYGTTFSNNVRRAYAALHLGIEVELIEVRPRTPAANTPEFGLLGHARGPDGRRSRVCALGRS